MPKNDVLKDKIWVSKKKIKNSQIKILNLPHCVPLIIPWGVEIIPLQIAPNSVIAGNKIRIF